MSYGRRPVPTPPPHYSSPPALTRALLVQHGSEENTEIETAPDEHLDVFWASGDVTEVKGRTAIERLYAVELAGRTKGPVSSGLLRRP